MSRVRVLVVVAIATGLVIMVAWVLATKPLRSTPIEIKDVIVQLAWPALVLITTLVGLLLRRRASRETKPPS